MFAPPLFNGPVASFTDANPDGSTIADFTATIDWGDGTPMTAGTISQPGGVGTAYIVSGSHTYADSGVTPARQSGTYPIQVFVVDDGGSRLTVDNTANVADNSIVLTGQLNPAIDSGLSTGTADVTNVTQPDFFGTSEPLSTRHPVGDPASQRDSRSSSARSRPAATARGTSSPTSPLADGHYSITATAIDQFGETRPRTAARS